jgi:hypothetical protein
MHYHGLPIDRPIMYQLAGRNFCVSFAGHGPKDDVDLAHQIGQSVMLDNGAYAMWRDPKLRADWSEWAAWVEPWLVYPTTWAVLPDSVTGGVEENDRLLREWTHVTGSTGAPVWHIDEPLARLHRLIEDYALVCFGSSGLYSRPGSVAWHRRIREAFDSIADSHGRVPPIHMLRGMAFSGGPYPFASVDSTDIARNHNRPQNNAVEMAARWDAMQPPALWHPVDQLSLMEEVPV